MAEWRDKVSPLFGERYEITGVLELLSPLHVGTGEVGEIKGVEGREGANERPGVARIVRDHEDKPYLPATTIKNLLRRVGEAVEPGLVSELFGTIKGLENTGNMGAILVRGASLEGDPPDVSQYPYVKTAGKNLGRGVFVAARTAIDPLSGVAADHKLFFQEMVAPGAKFGLRLTLIADCENGEHGRIDALKRILAALACERGVVTGRGQADGSGALRLRAKVTVAERTIDADGRLTESQTEIVLPTAAAAPRTLVFVCKGPFLSVDSSWDPDAAKGGDENKKVPQLVYQHGADKQPLDLGSQIAGVLRARARWIRGLKALEDRVDAKDVPKTVESGTFDEEIARKPVVRVKDDKENKKLVRTRDNGEQVELSSVERLFGVSGFAGLLAIETMRFSGAEDYEITSVKLDHFSGVPIDKALFTTHAVTGTKLELALALRDRGGAATPRAADRWLFEKLQADIEKNGLMLGHGTGKGFGWFKFEEGERDG